MARNNRKGNGGWDKNTSQGGQKKIQRKEQGKAECTPQGIPGKKQGKTKGITERTKREKQKKTKRIQKRTKKEV